MTFFQSVDTTRESATDLIKKIKVAKKTDFKLFKKFDFYIQC